MSMRSREILLFGLLFGLLSACYGADPSLTIYNQRFAVVREIIPLDLKQGVNSVQFEGATALLEPQSVMLRDPAGRRLLRILDQNYRADPVSMDALLRRYEGHTIEFQVRSGDKTEVVSGKIVRAGTTGPQAARYGDFMQGNIGTQMYLSGQSQSIVEVGGKLQFGLPGMPLFPGLGADMILKPLLEWTVETDRAGKLDAELAYISGGLNWSADYNIVNGDGNALDIIGWVTMENSSGKQFENAHVKLMAGDVNKIQPQGQPMGAIGGMASFGSMNGNPAAPPVEEKTFDEYHLYTLQRPATLHDKETKQVEFVRADGVKSDVVYIYDGMKVDTSRFRGWNADMIRNDTSYGTLSNNKVWVMREFINSEANHLGMPLPKGRVRFYRRDTDGRLEFTGEDAIDHTPKDEHIRVFTGSAFDLAGERKRTVVMNDGMRRTMDEGFEIKVRNHKKERADVRVVEHLYRGTSWDITASSIPWVKTDAQTIEFHVTLNPDEEKVVTYTAHYTW
jgi:hypothetical protein